MPLIQWDQAYSVSIDSIDNQHKRWIELVNNLHQAMLEGKGKDVLDQTLNAMIDYTKTHFTTEEKLMSQFAYGEFAEHKKLHDQFIDHIHQYQQRKASGEMALTIEVMTAMKDWLINHIQKVDSRYSGFLKEKGVK